MPNVKETLQYFSKQQTNYKTCLLTGNTRAGAFAKLRHYGIAQYFDSRYSACGELSEDRCELAKQPIKDFICSNLTLHQTTLSL